jgi:ryanodine receptor 2
MNSEPAYEPTPIDTTHIELPQEVAEVTERLAHNVHDVWAKLRMSGGWRYGHTRSDTREETPCLVPYPELPEAEKEYDRTVVNETLKALLALGFRIEATSVGPPTVQ